MTFSSFIPSFSPPLDPHFRQKTFSGIHFISDLYFTFLFVFRRNDFQICILTPNNAFQCLTYDVIFLRNSGISFMTFLVLKIFSAQQ